MVPFLPTLVREGAGVAGRRRGELSAWVERSHVSDTIEERQERDGLSFQTFCPGKYSALHISLRAVLLYGKKLLWGFWPSKLHKMRVT